MSEYLYMLQLANLSTVADLETKLGEEGERFLYLFLAFRASISEFKNLRHVQPIVRVEYIC